MKKLAVIFYSLCILTAWQCNSPGDKKTEQESSTTDSTEFKRNAFFTNVNSSSLAIAQLLELTEKSSMEELRSYGTSIKTEQEKIRKELISLAEIKNISLTDTLDERKAKRIAAVSEKKGTDFDNALVKLLSSEQRRLQHQFKKTEEVKDAELKGMAANVLPVLKQHIEELRNVRKLIAPDKESKKRKEVSA